MKLSSRSFARFSDFDLLKSHVAKAAYVSSIIGPLITVKDETTAALVVVITLRAGRRELQESVAHRGRSRGRAERGRRPIPRTHQGPVRPDHSPSGGGARTQRCLAP